jgi:hypothetical protein
MVSGEKGVGEGGSICERRTTHLWEESAPTLFMGIDGGKSE